MNYEVFKSNQALPFIQQCNTPLFNRVDWLSIFEENISNNLSPITYLISQKNNQTLLPLAKLADSNKLQSLSNYYTPHYQLLSTTPLASEDYLNTISSCSPELKKYDVIELFPILGNEVDSWQQAFESISFNCHIYQYSTNWYHDNITSLEQYWSLRSSRLKNTIKRNKNKLLKTGEFSIEIKMPKSEKDLLKMLADYQKVYSQSWKQEEPYPKFIEAITRYSWQQNELRLGLIYHNDKPIAAQIWFVNGKTAYIFKLAYTPEYHKFSVGTVLTAALIEYVINVDKVNCVDFLTGNDEYKKDWMLKQRPLFGIQASNMNTIKGNLLNFKNTLSDVKKKLLRKPLTTIPDSD